MVAVAVAGQVDGDDSELVANVAGDVRPPVRVRAAAVDEHEPAPARVAPGEVVDRQRRRRSTSPSVNGTASALRNHSGALEWTGTASGIEPKLLSPSCAGSRLLLDFLRYRRRMEEPRKLFDRRQALGALGVLGIGAITAACSSTKTASDAASASTSASSTSSSASTEGGTASTASGSPSCTLTPEATEGPFYLDINDVRQDITEGKAGAPLALSINVVDASACRAIKDAAIDIWHCDAGGLYSGVQAAAGTTFLRGTQLTDANGTATFDTIYPGWYQGRAVHIHMKVHVDNDVVHTGQLFFDDSLTDNVFQTNPYSARGDRDMRNEDDSIFSDAGGSSAIVPVTASGSNYKGSITVGVKTVVDLVALGARPSAMELDVAHIHEAIAAAVPDRECIVWRDRRLTWADVTERTRRLANLLLAARPRRACGSRVGRVVGVGAGPPRALPHQLQRVPRRHARRLQGPGRTVQRQLPVRRRRARLRAARCAHAAPSSTTLVTRHCSLKSCRSWITRRRCCSKWPTTPATSCCRAHFPTRMPWTAATPAAPAVEPTPDDLYIVYTGGTTGMPKGALWRQADFLVSALGVRRRDGTDFESLDEIVQLAWRRELRSCPAPPLMHGAAHWNAISTWTSGGTVVIQDNPAHLDAADILRTIERERVGVAEHRR